MKHTGSTFLCGCAPSINLMFFAKEVDEVSEQDTENSSFFAMSQGKWGKYKFAAAWSAISMATIKPSGGVRTVVAVAPHGAYWEVEPKSLKEIQGQISAAENSLRSLAVIDDMIYASGMGRTVLRRKNAGVWDEIGPGTLEDDNRSVVGLEDLAGFSTDEIYAVGWKGEIWQRRKNRWRRLDSPVSTNLNSVCCALDGKVYIVGDDGVMLRGRSDVWEVLETGRTDNLMDVAFYDKAIYVVTDFEILKLRNDSLIAEDAFANEDEIPGTCLHLLAADDGLISMGEKDLFRLHAGTWERLV